MRLGAICMKKNYVYKAVSHLDMITAKNGLIGKLNTFAVITIIVGNALAMLLNYIFRMRGEPGGMYFVYGLCGAAFCVLYIYLHELTHAVAIMSVKHTVPEIRFGKLVASCGAPMTAFSKAQYFFVASFPFLFYCAALIPLCILLPAVYFPMPFMPLCYNVFGSMGDMYMIRKMMAVPRRCVVIDNGTDVSAYMPVTAENQ